MAINVLTLYEAFQGKNLSAADIQAITNYGKQASDLWNQVDAAYQAYVANKSSGNLTALTKAIQTIQSELPQILADVHVSDTTALLSVISTIAAFYNVSSPTSVSLKDGRVFALPPAKKRSIRELKNDWNKNVAQDAKSLVIK